MRQSSGTLSRGPFQMRPVLTLILVTGLGLGLGGCANVADTLPFGDKSTPATVPNAAPDARGVITYANYQVVAARDGDTVATVAERLGIAPDVLGKRNGLPTTYLLRGGEILLLPDSFPRPAPADAAPTDGWSPERVATAIEGNPSTVTATPLPPKTTVPPPPPPAANPFQNGQKTPLIDPVRHRVEAGETAYSIARLYGVSVTALASWNGLGPDLTVRENQELLIPIVSGANQINGASDTQPGQETDVTPPPSAAEPLPENIVTGAPPESPDLGQYRTPQGGRLSAPVAGKISRPYNTANPNGVGYAVPAGTPVKAAAAGEIALISEELGGQGTIVLIRHKDDLMTTYSTLADVKVTKGEQVKAGQVIGTVAARDRPELQFDVFRGTTSVDPSTYLGN